MLRLKQGPPSGGVRTLHLLEKYPSLPRSSLSVVFRPQLIFPDLLFSPASLRRDPLLLLWLCVSGYLAKEAARWSCVRRQKGGRCFLTLLRLTWSVWGKHKRLACARSQTSQPLACFSPAFSSSSATAFRLQGHGEIKGVECQFLPPHPYDNLISDFYIGKRWTCCP